MTLYQPVHERFERFCRARAYGEMDFKDLMQETVMVALERFDGIRDKQAFLSFLFGTSIRILSNANRKRKEERWSDDYENKQSERNAGAHELDVQDLYKALSCLSDEQREALIFFEISGFSVREIAGMQDASESAVKQRLVRGRQELARLLSEEPVLEKNEL